MNPDKYYERSEVSNSDLTALKNMLHPRMQYGDREAAFRFGSLVDAIITEPSRADENLTKVLKDALALVDVRVLDHVVVAGGASVSFAQRGLL